jgi:hypothetical protein
MVFILNWTLNHVKVSSILSSIYGIYNLFKAGIGRLQKKFFALFSGWPLVIPLHDLYLGTSLFNHIIKCLIITY